VWNEILGAVAWSRDDLCTAQV